MGPEKFLTLVPVSLDENNYTYSNIWLVPILKKYITGASLAYYMEHIMPLAKSFKKASHKVKNSEEVSMHENVSTTLQMLVNENKVALGPTKNEPDCDVERDSSLEISMQPSFSKKIAYSKKAATRNIKALASIKK